MITNYLQWPIKDFSKINRPKVIVMGFFDGVHLGHVHVIEQAQQISAERKLPLSILTYDPHPSTIFKEHPEKLLTTLEQRLEKFAELKVDETLVMHFNDKFAHLTPSEFVNDFLVKLNPEVVVAGFDHTYGSKQLNADMRHLPELANKRFEVMTVESFNIGEKKISSTQIREEIQNNQLDLANIGLNYPYTIVGVVVPGNQRGRRLGFPTANLQTDSNQLIPNEGVYLSQIKINDQWLPALGSIGINPTFDTENNIVVEIYILNFDEDIYGKEVQVRWIQKIRNQVKFTNVDQLIKQLELDQQIAIDYFSQK